MPYRDYRHPYAGYSHKDELKKILDPNNEMTHMEFVESLRRRGYDPRNPIPQHL